MANVESNPVIIGKVIKKINLLAEQEFDSSSLDEIFIVNESEGAVVTAKEIEITLNHFGTIEHQLTSRGLAFLRGALVCEAQRPRRFYAGKRLGKRRLQHTAGRRTLAVHIDSQKKPDNKLDENNVFEYIDSVALETNDLSAFASEVNDKYDAFLKTSPVSFIPHKDKYLK